jgi:hypothetical protein
MSRKIRGFGAGVKVALRGRVPAPTARRGSLPARRSSVFLVRPARASVPGTAWHDITPGTDASSTALVTAYDPSTYTLTLGTTLAAATDATSTYELNSTTAYSEQFTSSATPTVASGLPTGAETLDASNIHSLSRSLTDSFGRNNENDTYTPLAGLTYTTAAAILPGAVAAINDRLDSLPSDVKNVLKNKGQVTAKGKAFSDVRPDGQWTDSNGVRHYYEVSSRTSQADPARLRANDPDGIVEVLNLDTGKTVVYHPGEPIP